MYYNRLYIYILVVFNIYIYWLVNYKYIYNIINLTVFRQLLFRQYYYNALICISDISLVKLCRTVYLWNIVKGNYISILKKTRSIYKFKNKFFMLDNYKYNINMLLLVYILNTKFISLVYLNNFISINYFISRLYIYLWRLIAIRNLYFYFVKCNYTDLLGITSSSQFYYASSELRNMLLRINLSTTFIILLVRSFYVRNISLFIRCIRRFIIYVGQRRSRHAIFVIYLFLRTILRYLQIYFKLKAYKIVLKGKIGMPRSRRKSTHILVGGGGFSLYSNYKCYKCQQICLVMGSIGIRVFFVY